MTQEHQLRTELQTPRERYLSIVSRLENWFKERDIKQPEYGKPDIELRLISPLVCSVWLTTGFISIIRSNGELFEVFVVGLRGGKSSMGEYVEKKYEPFGLGLGYQKFKLIKSHFASGLIAIEEGFYDMKRVEFFKTITCEAVDAFEKVEGMINELEKLHLLPVGGVLTNKNRYY